MHTRIYVHFLLCLFIHLNAFVVVVVVLLFSSCFVRSVRIIQNCSLYLQNMRRADSANDDSVTDCESPTSIFLFCSLSFSFSLFLFLTIF